MKNSFFFPPFLHNDIYNPSLLLRTYRVTSSNLSLLQLRQMFYVQHIAPYARQVDTMYTYVLGKLKCLAKGNMKF